MKCMGIGIIILDFLNLGPGWYWTLWIIH